MVNIEGDRKFFQEIMNLEKKTEDASVELKDRLNEIISHYDLSANATLLLLARISAAFILAMQKTMDEAGKDAIEDEFHYMLNTYLGVQNTSDLNKELDRMIKERGN